MQEPPWMPRTEEEYQQQLAEEEAERIGEVQELDLPDDINTEVYSSEYVWTECSTCGMALRKPVYDRDPVMCSYCADNDFGPDSATELLDRGPR